jgi:hypothetical protein
MATNNSAALRIIFGADTSQFDAALQQSLSKLEKTSRGLSSAGKTLSIGLTAPLTAVAATSAHTAINFEASMAKVQAVSQATKQEFEALRDQALYLGRTTVFTAQNVSELQLEFSKLGFTASEIQKVTEATLYLAQATGSDLAESAEVAGATLRGFGLNAEETVRVTDVMAQSFNATSLDLSNFREAMKYVAPVAKSAGVSLEQTTAMLGILANAGIKGSQAGTSLRRIISDLGAGSEDTATAIQNLADQGIDLADAKDEVGRTAQTALLVLSEGVGQVDSLTTSLEGAAGASAQMARTMNDTTFGSLKSMESAVEGAQIAIGNALAPTIEKLANIIGNAALSFQEMSAGARGTVIVIGAIAAAIGPVLLLAGTMVSAYGKLRIAMEGYTLAQLKANAAALVNPYTALAAAAAVLAYAIYKAATQTTEMEQVMDRVQKAQERGIENYAKEAAKVNQLAREYELFEDDLERRKVILKDLQTAAPGYFKDLNAEKTSYRELAALVSSYNQQLRARAIEQAFGDELTTNYADQLKNQEALRAATLEQAQAQDVINKGKAAYTTSVKDGVRLATTEGARLERATAEVNRLTREQKALASGARTLEDNIARARKELEALGAVTTPKPPADDKTTDTTVGLPPADTGPAKKTLKDVEEQLKAALERSRITQLIDPAEETRLRDLTNAYEDAARGAYELGAITSAENYRDQANTHREAAKALEAQKVVAEEVVTAEQEIQNTLQERLDDISALTFAGAALEETNQLTAQAFKEAAMAAALLGNPDLAAEYLKQAENIYLMGRAAEETSDKVEDVFKNFSQQVIASIEEAVTTSIVKLGELIGEAAMMGEPLKGIGIMFANIGADLLTTLGAVAIEVGKTSIMTGTAVEAIKAALKSLNGGLAIAAGVALLALGAVAKGALAKAANPPALAQGGITSGPTLALIGDNPSGKEAVIPFERMGEFLRMAGAGGMGANVVVTGRLRGRDIMLSNERTLSDRKRTR